MSIKGYIAGLSFFVGTFIVLPGAAGIVENGGGVPSFCFMAATGFLLLIFGARGLEHEDL